MQYTIVLVAPQGERNVGSVCRAMANFGLGDLRLVAPEADFRSDAARQMAVHAASLLDEAAVFESLVDALQDCHYAFATTRRYGKYRRDIRALATVAHTLARLPHDARVALVFGREDKGLTTAELSRCHGFLTIPTDPRMPSMNLAQAVAVCLYELHRNAAGHGDSPAAAAGRDLPAPISQLDTMMGHMQRTLSALGYLNHQNPEHILRTYRRIFGRAVLTERDVRVLEGLWSKIDWLLDVAAKRGAEENSG